MYENIYQTGRRPIEEFIDENKYYSQPFVGEVADYIDKTNRENAIDRLKQVMDGIATFDGDTFVITNKEKYFEKKYKSFKELTTALGGISFEEFASNKGRTDMYVWQLRDVYNQTFDIYVDDEYLGIVTLDQFVRYSENGQRFYIGSTMVYHY